MILALVEDEGVRQVEVRADGSLYTICADGGEPVEVDAHQVGPGRWSLLIGERSYQVQVGQERSDYTVEIDGRSWTFCLTDPARALLRPQGAARHGAGLVKAPMPGRVLRVLVKPGQAVQHGDGIVVVEAMKMENELSAPRDGVVEVVHVAEGDTVEGGADLVLIGA